MLINVLVGQKSKFTLFHCFSSESTWYGKFVTEEDWNRSSKWRTSKANWQDGRTKEEFITKDIKRRVFYIGTKKGSIFNGSSGDDMYLTRKNWFLWTRRKFSSFSTSNFLACILVCKLICLELTVVYEDTPLFSELCLIWSKECPPLLKMRFCWQTTTVVINDSCYLSEASLTSLI